MALVAVRAVVNVVAYSLVMLVGCRLGVADRTREHRVITRIGVAITAHLRPSVCLREPRVVESCTGPSRRRVTGGAGGWEPCRSMVWVRSVLIVGFVAPVAVCRKRRVVVVHVAIDALTRRNRVRTG